MSGAQAEVIPKFMLVAAVGLVTIIFTLQPVTSYADEAADIAQILELNDAYAEATRAWRAKEITRAELRERQQAIQAQSRAIHSRYGSTGSPERRTWDRKVAQAKTAYAKQKRREEKAARAAIAAEERAEKEAERAAATREAEAQAAEELENEARLTAELRTQMREDYIDSQTGWIAYDAVDQTIRDQHQALLQKWSSSHQAERFNRRVFEHFINLLRERSALTTSERRAPLKAQSENSAEQAEERDAAPWVATQPRVADVIAAYPGNDPESSARQATALSLVAQSFSQVPNWNKASLKATLIETEYQLALFDLDRRFPAGSRERATYDQTKVATRRDPEFVLEVAEAFQPQEVARQDTAAEWHHIRTESDALGATVGKSLAVVLTLVVVLWALLSMIQTARGGFEAKEVDGRLDVAYKRNMHGILAMLSAAVVWGLLVTILVLVVMPDEEPQFLKNAVLRDPSNAGIISFSLWFFILGVPAVGLLLLNLLRLGTKRFSISPAGVVMKNQTYFFTDEPSFFVEAPDAGPERTIAQQSGGVFFIGSGPAVGAALAGATVAQGMRAGQQAAHGIGQQLAVSIARVRFSICFTHQGGTSVLAKGLSRRRANAILDRIGEYLNAEPLEGAAE